MTLSGDSNSYSQGITIADGGGTKDDGGILVANHASALGSGTTTVEHGKLAVAGGITVTNTIQGQGTNSSDQKSLVGGGSGTTVGTITNGGSILNIGSRWANRCRKPWHCLGHLHVEWNERSSSDCWRP